MNHPGASERLQEFVADRLAAYKVPTKIWTLNEDLPTEAAGKVQKKELKAFYAECVCPVLTTNNIPTGKRQSYKVLDT